VAAPITKVCGVGLPLEVICGAVYSARVLLAAFATVMLPTLSMLMPLGSSRLVVAPTSVAPIVTAGIGAGVMIPPPAIEAAVNSTTVPSGAPVGAVNCSLVIHRSPLLSNRIPQGLLILGIAAPSLFSTVCGVTPIVPAAALRTAAAISTTVVPPLLSTHRLPAPS